MGSADRASLLETSGLSASDLDQIPAPSAPARPNLQLQRLILNLPLQAIQGSSPAQPRQAGFDPEAQEEDAELLASIQEHGVLEPVMVQRTSAPGPDSTFRLVFGHRRCAAATQAGMTHVPALIANPEDPVDLLTLAENTGTLPLSPYERALALEHLHRLEPGQSLRELARRTGLSPSSVSNLLRAYRDSTPPLRSLFASGLDARAVVELQPLFQSLPEPQQVELARDLPGTSRAHIRELLDRLSEGQTLKQALHTEKTPALSSLPNPAKTPPDVKLEVSELVRQTGASCEQVQDLLHTLPPEHITLPAVQLLCLASARGPLPGSPGECWKTAVALLSDPVTARLLQDHLRLRMRLQTRLNSEPAGPARSLLELALGAP